MFFMDTIHRTRDFGLQAWRQGATATSEQQAEAEKPINWNEIFRRGDRVEMFGLQGAASVKYNGTKGTLVTDYVESKGRYGVR